jgi:phosphatidylglycerophosphatase A
VNRLAVTLATWFGCGFWPWGPGTVGSLAALLIAILVDAYAGNARFVLVALILALLAPAVWAATETSRQLNSKDPSIVVIDEALGQWLTLLGATTFSWKSFLAGFLLFRLFDIWKPWPVRRLEKLPGGTGIVADDIAAGLYGALILYIGGTLRLY